MPKGFIQTGGGDCMEFECVRDCSQCCVQREYYPSKEFGKIGVLILPHEKAGIEKLAAARGVAVSILPRIGVSDAGDTGGGGGPSRIIAYQMMGRDEDGNTCPFLDTDSDKRSGHGGYVCGIYGDRPLACSAYPLIGTDPVALDQRCRFCTECGSTTADGGLDAEARSLARIAGGMDVGESCTIWRYATGVGEAGDAGVIKTGWIRTEG